METRETRLYVKKGQDSNMFSGLVKTLRKLGADIKRIDPCENYSIVTCVLGKGNHLSQQGMMVPCSLN